MSLRQVLTIYNAERQLNEDDVALLNTLRKLNDNDREMLVQGLSDKSQKRSSKKATTRCVVPLPRTGVACGFTEQHLMHHDKDHHNYHEFSSKKTAGGSGRSKRGESLKGQLDNRRQERGAMVYCIRDINGLECSEPEASTIHSDSTYVNYHEFVAPPASSAAGAGD